MKVAVIVQARMSSTRLPRKVLLPLAGVPAIVQMMARVRRVERADACIVATSVHPTDDALAEVCDSHGLTCVRGALDDVLDRMHGAVPPDCDVVVRLTGDCPLIDPAIVDRHIECFVAEQPHVDYVSNAVVRTQPDGLDVEVISRAMLDRARKQACTPHDREHVTPWIRRRARTRALCQEVDLSALRWTLDTKDDYDNIAALYDALYDDDPTFDSGAIYRLLLRRPALIRVAASVGGDEAFWAKRIEAHLEDCRDRIE